MASDTPTAAAAATPDLQTVVKYLCGEGPLCGVWFGDGPPAGEKGSFWWRRHLRAALAAPAAQEAEPVATVQSYTNGSYWRNYKLDWHRDVPEGTKLYAHPPRPQADAGAVPEGWQLVPVEPTEQMEMAGRQHAVWGLPSNAALGYRAMCAAAPQAPAAVAPAERQYICPVKTVADLANNLLTLDQSLPIYAAQAIEHDGRRRIITVPPTLSRERVKDKRWIGEGEQLNAAVIWTRSEQPAAAPAQEADGWMPIETAPKDGRTLLLGYYNLLGKWRTLRGKWVSADQIAEYWEDEAEPGWYETSVEAEDPPNAWSTSPTHWRIPPAPPAARARQEGGGAA